MIETNRPDVYSVDEFSDDVQALVRGKPVKLWLARSNGVRFDILFSFGSSQTQPMELLDRGVGYYLIGENIDEPLRRQLHTLFSRFIQYHCAVPHYLEQREHHPAIHITHHAHRDHKLTMHYPYAPPDSAD